MVLGVRSWSINLGTGCHHSSDTIIAQNSIVSFLPFIIDPLSNDFAMCTTVGAGVILSNTLMLSRWEKRGMILMQRKDVVQVKFYGFVD